MKLLLQEAAGYAIASAAALAVDMSILFGLVNFLHWWYLAAATLSFTAGVIVAYAISVRLVFKFRRLESRRREFAAFALIGVVGMIMNAATMFVAVSFLGWNYMLGKCLAAAGTFLCNFGLRRQFLFARNVGGATGIEFAPRRKA